MIGLPVEFAYIKPGDDFFFEGDRFGKITDTHAESISLGTRREFEPQVKVTHATCLPLFTPEDLFAAAEINLTPYDNASNP